MGLHTIDSVRRDAAQERLWFDTKPWQGKAEVEIALAKGQPVLVYTIDMEEDVIEKITFVSKNVMKGELTFSYLQNISGVENKFTPPARKAFQEPNHEQLGIWWLVRLGQGEFGK